MTNYVALPRLQAMAEAGRRRPRARTTPLAAQDPSSFASLTFNADAMRRKLSHASYKALQETVTEGLELEKICAGEVAHAMKEWALELGADRFCHWFQPQNGLTAEKHDSFLAMEAGLPMSRFSADQLIRGEPDASSLPSGGMRTTFEARGYTAWDPTSPVFIMDGPRGRTMCVPSVFVSHHGKALDRKTPLLRSMDYLSREATAVLHLLGDTDIQRVVPSVGAEQEFFLVDRAWLYTRPDILAAGRTLLGAAPPKGQLLEDHYFGSIRPRVLAFLQDVEHRLHLLGVPVKTRHNEVAPGQFELAPIHEEANVASDHNQILMEVLRMVADDHHLAVLLHEKPFAGVNGSGKHCNWSLLDSRGRNLLHPGQSPRQNLHFLVFLVATLVAVHRRGDLLRAAVASWGNDHRLGSHEAPPAIISVYLGEALSRILDAVEARQPGDESPQEDIIRLGISRLPLLERDTTDRNRTSPMAFTGSRFEFRAVGSSAVVATPVAYLNAAVGEALGGFADAMEEIMGEGGSPEQAALDVLATAIGEVRPVLFDGNSYSQAWVEEAERRGLPHLATTPAALERLRTPEARGFFKTTGLYDEEELESRYHVKMERYVKVMLVEARSLLEMARTMVLPAALRCQGEVARTVSHLSTARMGARAPHLEELLEEISSRVEQLMERCRDLDLALSAVDEEEQVTARALAAEARLAPAMQGLRRVADALEVTVPDDLWPLPRYREMLGAL